MWKNSGSGQNPMWQNTGAGQNPMWRNSGAGQNPMWKNQTQYQKANMEKFSGKEVNTTKAQCDKEEALSRISKRDEEILKMVNEFSEVFDKENLPPMDTEPMVIKLRENYVPKALTIPRKVPYARREKEIKEIRKMEAEGIIEPVGDRPTEFCSPTICPIKPDGTLRFATDFTYLNKQVLRTVHPTMSSWDAIHSIDPKAQYFSTFDCKKGYWQVPLAEESKDLTVFICTLV